MKNVASEYFYSQCVDDISIILSGSIVRVNVVHFHNVNCGYVINIILTCCQVYTDSSL